MANYSRRADGLVELEGAPAPLALTDDQLASLGHVPAELQGLPPGATAFNEYRPAPRQGTMSDAADSAFGQYLKPTGPAPEPAANTVSRGATPGIQSLLQGTAPDQLKVESGADKLEKKAAAPAKPEGTTTNLPDAPQGGGMPAMGYGGGGSRPRVIKGGIQLAGYKQETGVPLTDQQIDEAVGLKRAEQEANEEAQALGIRREADTVKKQADQLAFQHARLAGEREKRKAIDESILEAQNAMQSRENELSQMPAPKMKDYWEDKGILGRIGSVLALVSGGALQGLQGRGDNPGQTMLNGIYEQWAGEKREQYERAKDDAARAKTRYGQLIQLYGTPEEADKALRAEAAQVAGMQIENYAQMMKTPEQVAQLRALQAQNGQERIKLKSELLKAREGRIEKTYVNAPDRVVGGGGPKVNPKDASRLVRLPGGGYAYARSDVDARKVQDQVTAVGSIKRDAQLLMKLSQEAGNRIPMSEAKAQMQTIKMRMMLATKNAEQMGALDKGTQEVFDQMVGSPENMINQGAAGNLREIINGADGKVNDLTRDYLHVDPESTMPVLSGEPEGVEVR